nr:sulfotransferase [Salinibacter ruber]
MKRNRSLRPKGFIVGMSRSGTKWMSMCLNQHPEVAVFGETGFWGKDFIQPQEGGLSPSQCKAVLQRMPGIRSQRRDENGILHVEGQATPVGAEVGGLVKLFKPLAQKIQARRERVPPRELFGRMCAVVSATEEKPYVIEKTPHHVNWMERITDAYPNARFIVMYREPYGFMRSYKHQGNRKKERIKKQYKKLYHPLGCSIVYRGYAKSIAKAKSEYPDKTLLVELGDIKKGGAKIINKVCNFLNIPFSGQCVLPKLNTSFPREKKDIGETDMRWMNLIAGREIEKIGFELEKSSVSPAKMLKSASSIPYWGMNVWRHIKNRQNYSTVKYVKKWLHL